MKPRNEPAPTIDTPPGAARILIVDDEPGILEVLDGILSEAGYRTEAAASGPEALGRARRDPPDLIVLDVAMPEMDGFEVCRQLKADPRTATLPVLFVTGLGALRDKEEGLLAGGDDYVTKCVAPADLLARVRALLRVRHLSLELDRTLAYLQEIEAARGAGAALGSGGQGFPTSIGRLSRLRDEGTGRQGNGPAPHILLVDDDRQVRELYGKLIERAGYRVTAVPGAAAAYEAAARGVDVILLDLMMPGISGLEALERLRQLAPDVPILIVTAYQSAQNAVAALRGGAFDFIVKGLRHEILLNGVARALERRRLNLENRRLMEELRGLLDAALTTSARNG